MALTSGQVASAWKRWIDEILKTDVCTFDRPALEAAVTAVDSWCTANAANFNSALPDPFKSTATPAQKAALLAFVCIARYGGQN